MFAAALIVFRESLEAALIISIMVAATRSIPNRGRWIWGGVLFGLIGAVLVASGMGAIANFADGIGQELFNTGVLIAAVAMLAWHNIWMAAHSAELSRQISTTARAISEGTRECSVILFVIALAVLREGAETVLFLYGVLSSEGGNVYETLMGSILGLGLGLALAGGLYLGLLRIPIRWFFKVAAALVLLLAANMASQAARYLVQADLLPSLGAPIWDSSHLLEQTTIVGSVLHNLVGYEAQPAGMQVIFYLAVGLSIFIGMRWVENRPRPKPAQ